MHARYLYAGIATDKMLTLWAKLNFRYIQCLCALEIYKRVIFHGFKRNIFLSMLFKNLFEQAYG